MAGELNQRILTPNIENNTRSHMIITSDYKRAIKEVCSYGRYQSIIYYTIILSSFLCGFIITAFPVQKEIPNYFCIDNNEFENKYEKYSVYTNTPNYKIINSEECTKKYCNEDSLSLNKVLIADYGQFRNFVTMLDIMCHMDTFSGNFFRYLFLGRILAIFLVSYISDNKGRYKALKILVILLFITNVGFFLFRTISAYLFLVFFSSMSMQMFNVMTVYSVETMNDDVYSVLNGMIGTSHAFCGVFNIVIMYLFKDWLVLLSIHIVLDVINIYLVFSYFVETPMFCLIKKDYEKMKKSISFIANLNGIYEIKIEPILREIDSLSYTYKDINDFTPIYKENTNGSNVLTRICLFIDSLFVPYKKIFTRTKDFIDLCYLIIPFATVFFVYYGQLLFIERLPGNTKINSFLIFFSELFSPSLAGYLLKKMKRKTIYSAVFLICIILCLLLSQAEKEYVVSILLFLNSFFISINFIVGYVYTAELFESCIKTSVLGILVLFSNLLIVPGDILLGLFSSPFYLFIIMMGISAICLIKVSETKL